jgi:hypothetical protein
MTFRCPDLYRVRHGAWGTAPGAPHGAFFVPTRLGHPPLKIIATNGMHGDPIHECWEHVSVSLPDRCPTWEEMARVKALFWEPADCVVQFHPPESEYVNHHPFCLHLWRPIGEQIKTPPAIFIGPRENRGGS